uniref:TSC22 domain family, member 2 n=1 Tax=Mola mola TaxID=94237 RepID=A0A3Q3WR80_MOLML
MRQVRLPCVSLSGRVSYVSCACYSLRLLSLCFCLCVLQGLCYRVLFSYIYASGASVVAIDNKIEQAMDLVKSHLMYAVREEVEVLKEHIKELYERNSVLERENAVLKSLANSEQLGQLSSQLTQSSSSTSPLLQQQHPPVTNNTTTPLSQLEGSQSVHHQPNITSA